MQQPHRFLLEVQKSPEVNVALHLLRVPSLFFLEETTWVNDGRMFVLPVVGGRTNPFEQYEYTRQIGSNWIISPGIGGENNYLKPPPRKRSVNTSIAPVPFEKQFSSWNAWDARYERPKKPDIIRVHIWSVKTNVIEIYWNSLTKHQGIDKLNKKMFH